MNFYYLLDAVFRSALFTAFELSHLPFKLQTHSSRLSLDSITANAVHSFSTFIFNSASSNRFYVFWLDLMDNNTNNKITTGTVSLRCLCRRRRRQIVRWSISDAAACDVCMFRSVMWIILWNVVCGTRDCVCVFLSVLEWRRQRRCRRRPTTKTDRFYLWRYYCGTFWKPTHNMSFDWIFIQLIDFVLNGFLFGGGCWRCELRARAFTRESTNHRNDWNGERLHNGIS